METVFAVCFFTFFMCLSKSLGGLEPDEKAEKIKEVVTTKSPTIKGAKKSTKRYGYQNQLSVEGMFFDRTWVPKNDI